MDARPPLRKRAPRRDAERRREALLCAASSCFQEFGYTVPLEVIAERAGVGRGTLYRNFRDREALALAIFAQEVENFGELLDPAAPIESSLDRMIREGAAGYALFQRIAADMERNDPSLAAFQALRERLEQILAPVVRLARERGEIDADISAADLVLLFRMAGALLLPFRSAEEITDDINAALRLLLRGVRPR